MHSRSLLEALHLIIASHTRTACDGDSDDGVNRSRGCGNGGYQAIRDEVEGCPWSAMPRHFSRSLHFKLGLRVAVYGHC